MAERPMGRWLHPVAWWLWAVALAVGAMRTSNPVLLLLTVTVVCVVVDARRPATGWARSFGLLLRLAGLTLALTLTLQLLIGVRVPGHVLVSLPSLPLPSWLAGLSVGGPVTAEALLGAAGTGLRLGTLMVCFGAANALAHPARLLRILPAALYEVGVAVVVALTFVPQLAETVARVRIAQRLRGRTTVGVRGLRGLLVPVLEGALERAIALAASMDSRGYGRRAAVPSGQRRLTAALVLAGLLGAVVGTYAVIDPGGDRPVGLSLLAGGTLVGCLGALLAGRRTHRTRYQPDQWRWQEWLTVGTAAAALAASIVAVHDGPAAPVILGWPQVPPLAVAGLLIAALPAWLTPAPPTDLASTGRRPRVAVA